jgi:hypothetical protein
VEEGAKSVAGSDVVLRRAREFPDTVQNLNKEGGYAKQVYESQALIPECTLDDLSSVHLSKLVVGTSLAERRISRATIESQVRDGLRPGLHFPKWARNCIGTAI